MWRQSLKPHSYHLRQKITTPHELDHGKKSDLRVLLPLFSVLYLKRLTKSKGHCLASADTRSICAILLGCAPQSNCYYFYHSTTKRNVYLDDFKLDETCFAGPTFNLNYNEGIYLNSCDNLNNNLSPPEFPPESTVYLQSCSPAIPETILQISDQNSDIYTIKLPNSDIWQVCSEELRTYDPNTDHASNANNLPPTLSWLQHQVKCNLPLDSISSPKHGQLLYNNKTKTWF